MAIRETWGNKTLLESYFVKGFVRGPYFIFANDSQTITKSEYLQLELEMARFGDLHELPTRENHGDLAQKLFLSYKWIATMVGHWKYVDSYLKSPEDGHYILRADDDSYIDIFRIIHHFHDQLHAKQINSLQYDNSFYCNVNKNASVIRDPNDKYFIPYSIYKGEKYPVYCAGISYLFDSRLLPTLLETSFEMMLPIHEDVLFTGIVAEKLGTNHYQVPGKLSHYSKHRSTTILCRKNRTSSKIPILFHNLTLIEMTNVHRCATKLIRSILNTDSINV